MIELTPFQCQELQSPEPVAINPATRETYVLISKNAFDRMKTLLNLEEYDPDEGLEHLNEILSEDDANDPLLESYQAFGKRP